jgi:WD40 repeat protein
MCKRDVRTLENSSKKEIAHLTHEGLVTSAAFSPDKQYIVSGSEDGTARVWETFSGKEIARLAHDEVVTSVAFSSDGQYVLSGSEDGAVRLWMYRPDDLIRHACLRTARNLTRDEWQQYVGDALPYQAVCENLPIETEPTPTP